MDEPIQDPRYEAINQLQESLASGDDTFTRVCRQALSIDEYTHPSEVAELADCSENTAKKYLKRLATIGVVKRNETSSLRYEQNDGYLEWWWANQLATKHAEEALIDRIDFLENRDEAFRDKFDRDSPAGIPMIDRDEDLPTSEKITEGREWRHVKRQLQIHEIAWYIQESEGRLVSSL